MGLVSVERGYSDATHPGRKGRHLTDPAVFDPYHPGSNRTLCGLLVTPMMDTYYSDERGMGTHLPLCGRCLAIRAAARRSKT